MAKKNKVSTIYSFLGGLLIIGLPLAVGFGFLLDDAVENFVNNLPQTFSTVMMWVSIIMCVYCLLRTFLGVVYNVFLPKIPAPKNMILKVIVLAIIGTLIGFFSPVWLLVLWVITCLIGMGTYSFV